jgi:hypothetical protein
VALWSLFYRFGQGARLLTKAAGLQAKLRAQQQPAEQHSVLVARMARAGTFLPWQTHTLATSTQKELPVKHATQVFD